MWACVFKCASARGGLRPMSPYVSLSLEYVRRDLPDKQKRSKTNETYFVTDNGTSSFPEEICAKNLLIFKYSDSFLNHPR